MRGSTEQGGALPEVAASEPLGSRLLRLSPRLAAGAAVALGATVLTGWALRVGVLTSIIPGEVAIRPNAALGFVLCGVALWLLSPAPARARARTHRAAGRACAAAAGLLGGLTFLEYVAGVDLRIDLLLFTSAQLETPARIGGRMGANAAFNFLLLGGALLALDWRPRVRPSDVLAGLVGLVAVTALVGHLFGEADFYSLRFYTPMAIPGAIVFGLLALGLLAARPSAVLRVVAATDSAGGALARRLLPWVLVTPPAIGWLRLRGEQSGYFDLEFGLSLMVVSSMVLLGAVVLWTARSLDRSDLRRRQAERALRRNEVLLSAVFDATTDTIFVKDPAGRYITINAAGARTLGRPVAEILGRDDDELLPPATARARRAQRAEILADGTTRTVEEELVVDGVPRIFLSTKGVYRDEHGAPAGIFGMARDVTELKQVDEVRRARDAAESANRELEAFAYSVSHDLRAPLRSIDGFSQALLDDCHDRLDEPGRHYLERVRANAQHMAQLIDDLLDLSRVSRGELDRGQVDLSATAREIVTELRRGQPERQVDVVIADGLRATGDARLLRVALQNLLGNAWKFTARQASARVELGRDTTNGAPAYFVKDDGAGFDMRYGDKLFGAFQRLHSAKEFEGNGIGLATVQRIVRRHGGRIWATGAVGAGATFYFTLP